MKRELWSVRARFAWFNLPVKLAILLGIPIPQSLGSGLTQPLTNSLSSENSAPLKKKFRIIRRIAIDISSQPC